VVVKAVVKCKTGELLKSATCRSSWR